MGRRLDVIERMAQIAKFLIHPLGYGELESREE